MGKFCKTDTEVASTSSLLFQTYLQTMLEKFGVAFGAGSICMRSMRNFPLLSVSTHKEDYIGGLDYGLLISGRSFQDLLAGFIVLPPQVQAMQVCAVQQTCEKR